MGQVLSIVYHCIAWHLIKKAGFSRKAAQTGAFTLTQRFGSAFNLNIHPHLMMLDRAYTFTAGRPRFHRARASSASAARRSSGCAPA